GVRGGLPAPDERARQDLLAVGEVQLVADLEGPLGGVVVGLPRLGDHAVDLGVVGVAVVGLGQPVVERAADLPTGARRVDSGIDVLGGTAGEGREVNDLAALGELAVVDGLLGTRISTLVGVVI